MGVAEGKIAIGADWAWLYQPEHDARQWAEDTWASLGVDPHEPLLVVNPVNMIWRDFRLKQALSATLDEASRKLGLQIAFFCNECRSGDFFDAAAAREVQEEMSEPSVIVPPEYYSPSEAVALTGFATVTVAQRYHFAVESVMAGTVPVCIVRGQKMASLVDELGLVHGGAVDNLRHDILAKTIRDVLQNRQRWVTNLARLRTEMASRASHNLDLIASFPPYQTAMARGGIVRRILRKIRRLNAGSSLVSY
jgi:polysaccharide pyruvyl transferase WcaK-like protein